MDKALNEKYDPQPYRKKYSRKYIFNRTQGTCIYCGLQFKDEHDPRFTFEHLAPLSKGGIDELKNLYPCCKQCNNHRGSRELKDWLKIIIAKRQAYKGVYHITNRLDAIIIRLEKMIRNKSNSTYNL